MGFVPDLLDGRKIWLTFYLKELPERLRDSVFSSKAASCDALAEPDDLKELSLEMRGAGPVFISYASFKYVVVGFIAISV